MSHKGSRSSRLGLQLAARQVLSEVGGSEAWWRKEGKDPHPSLSPAPQPPPGVVASTRSPHHKLGPPRCLPPPSLPPGALWARGITRLDRGASAQASALRGASGPAHRPVPVPASLPSCLHLCRSLCAQRTIPSPGAPQAHHDSLSCLLHKVCRDPPLQPVTPTLCSAAPSSCRPRPARASLPPLPWLDTSSPPCAPAPSDLLDVF